MSVGDLGQGILRTHFSCSHAAVGTTWLAWDKWIRALHLVSSLQMPTVWTFAWGTAQSINDLTDHWSFFHKTWILAIWRLLKRKLEYYRKEKGWYNKGNILRRAFPNILGFISSRKYPFISNYSIIMKCFHRFVEGHFIRIKANFTVITVHFFSDINKSCLSVLSLAEL